MSELLEQLQKERASHKEALELFLRVGLHQQNSLGLLRRLALRVNRRHDTLMETERLLRFVMRDFVLDYQHYPDDVWVAVA
jgi:hypothetical protein